MQIRFLGTGGAEGIPAINCECAHCSRAGREGGRLVRGRTAVLFSLPGYQLLMDASLDIRGQLQLNGVRTVDGIFLTHEHADHSAGLEEFVYWQGRLDLFAEPQVYRRLARHWDGGLLDIACHLAVRPGRAVRFNGFHFIPFEVSHSVPCFGLALYQDGRHVVHLSDTGRRLSNYARSLIDGVDLLIINTPFFEYREAQAHMSVEEAVALKDEMGVKRLVLTHINHFNRPHDDLEKYAGDFPGVIVAYDGLTIDL